MSRRPPAGLKPGGFLDLLTVKDASTFQLGNH
jgi:hypothetical protein